MCSSDLSAILEAESADPCPFGRPKANDAEIEVVAEAMQKASGSILHGQPARNLAYHALIALRSANSDWHRDASKPLRVHPDVLAAHAQFGGDLADMQRRYDAAE